MQLFRSIFIIYNKFTKIYEYISLIINMRIQINSFEFTDTSVTSIVYQDPRRYNFSIELPKDFQRAE